MRKSTRTYLLINIATAIALIAGYHYHIAGAANIALFMFWFAFVVVSMCAGSANLRTLLVDQMAKQGGPSVSLKTAVLIDVALLFLLLWADTFGAFVAALVHALTSITSYCLLYGDNNENK